MILDLETRPLALQHDLSEWSAAEVLDTLLPDNLTLRATVCRLERGKWQWSVTTLDGVRGELISTGVEKSADVARLAAQAEIAKCLEEPSA